MKKTFCLLVVLCSLIVLPFSALGSTKLYVHEYIEIMVATLPDSVDWCNVTYDYTQNAIVLDVAENGLAETIAIVDENENLLSVFTPKWQGFKENMINSCTQLKSGLNEYVMGDVHLILRIVNDDAVLRNDYSTITYNPLLVIKDGVVVTDIVEDVILD